MATFLYWLTVTYGMVKLPNYICSSTIIFSLSLAYHIIFNPFASSLSLSLPSQSISLILLLTFCSAALRALVCVSVYPCAHAQSVAIGRCPLVAHFRLWALVHGPKSIPTVVPSRLSG